MSTLPVKLYAEPPTEGEEAPRLEDVIREVSHLPHAGKETLDFLLENPDEIPTVIDGEEISKTDPRLFCGTIEEDNNGNKFVWALYYKRNGWVTEKYWLTYPLLPTMVFALTM